MTKPSLRVLGFGAICVLLLASVAFWQPAPPSGEAAEAEEASAPDMIATNADRDALEAVEPPPPPEDVETLVIKRGQTLSGVLESARIRGRDLSALLLAVREHKNPRRLAAGTEVTIRRPVDAEEPSSVAVRLNADSTLVVVNDELIGWSPEMEVTSVVLDTISASGTIEAGESLFESVVNLEDSTFPYEDRFALVPRLAGIYEYKLDFLHDIQPGDTYRLVYERESRPDGTSRTQRILVAELVNHGKTFPAVHFDGGDGFDYYDEEGGSMRLAFKRYPLDYVRITSSFSWRRYHPVHGVYRAHVGTDFGARAGTPVRATGNGTVQFAGRNGGYGNLIKLRHPGGYTTRYAHLRGFASGIRPGARVEQGEVIGYVGATGTVTAAHLHYEFRKDGAPVNPRTVELPSAEPVAEELLDEYRRTLEDRRALLERMVPKRDSTMLVGSTGPVRTSGGR